MTNAALIGEATDPARAKQTISAANARTECGPNAFPDPGPVCSVRSGAHMGNLRIPVLSLRQGKRGKPDSCRRGRGMARDRRGRRD